MVSFYPSPKPRASTDHEGCSPSHAFARLPQRETVTTISIDLDDEPEPAAKRRAQETTTSSVLPPERRWGSAGRGHSIESSGTALPNLALTSSASDNSGKWLIIQGADMLDTEPLRQAHERWRKVVEKHVLEGALFEDPEFPADNRSISGNASAGAKSPSAGGTDPPRCGCFQSAKKSVVQNGNNKGRPYWHCGTRSCGFFLWADAEARRNANFWWQRFSEFMIVSDFGFRAEDLRQGGVGDCWFMSALAVVAERPDLILNLFGGETAKNAAGCYQLRLFLDGTWTNVTVDDRLPCTDRQRRPDGSGLAYSRADGQQLWTALLEKAYAKAHGSYRAISGGEIAEALLDLTGAPTESIDFDEHGFDPQELWRRLLSFKRQGLPMGCATAGNPELREVGLCGNHAYSILDVREIYDVRFAGRERGFGGAEEDGLIRLLRIRNPHGTGEWNGEWSDKSAEWTSNLAAELGRTNVDDGTFWMDYTHFLMAFQVVDVCMAHRGWHAQSFDNAFCDKSSGSRLCKYVYELRCRGSALDLYAMALQPTKRGSWCRDDRRKSYKPGDVSLFLLRLDKSGSFDTVVGGNFFSADFMARRSIHARLDDPDATYLLVAFCFGTGPTAPTRCTSSDSASKPHRTGFLAPFKIRLFSSGPLLVRPGEIERRPQLATAAISGLHCACLCLSPAPGRRFRRQLRRLGTDVNMCQIRGEGTVLLLVANDRTNAISVRIRAEVKVMTVRSSEGLLASQELLAEKQQALTIVCFNCGQPGHVARDCPQPKGKGKGKGGIRPPWRWPAKWRQVSTTCVVPAGMQRIAAVLVGNGMQAELGSVEAQLEEAVQQCQSSSSNLEAWFLAASKGQPRPIATETFAPRPLLKDLVAVACIEAQPDLMPMLDREIDAAKEISLALVQLAEQNQLEAALVASVSVGGQARRPQPPEDVALAAALAASAAEQSRDGFALDVLNAPLNGAREESVLMQVLAASKSETDELEAAELAEAMFLSRSIAVPSNAAAAVEVLDSDSEEVK